MASRRDAPGNRASSTAQWKCTGKCGGCPNYISRAECRACGAKAPPSILAALKLCQPLGLGAAPWRDGGGGAAGAVKPQGKAKAKPKGARGAQWSNAKDWQSHFGEEAAGTGGPTKAVADLQLAELLAATNKALVAAGKDGLTDGQLSAAPPAPEAPKQEVVDIASRPLAQVLQRKADKAKQVEKSKGRLEERAQELAAAQEAYDAELRQLREHEAKLAELEAIEKTKCAEAAMGSKGLSVSVAAFDQLGLLLDALGQHEDMQEGKASLAELRTHAAKAREKVLASEQAAAAAKAAASPGTAPAAGGPGASAGGGTANGGMDVEVPDFDVDEDLADLVAAEMERMGASRPTYDLGKPDDVDKLKRAAPKLLDAAVLQAKRQKL